MYRILIYHDDEVIEELDKTSTVEEAEELGIKYIEQLENKDKYWFKIKAD